MKAPSAEPDKRTAAAQPKTIKGKIDTRETMLREIENAQSVDDLKNVLRLLVMWF